MDELSWSDLLLGIVIYAAVHAMIADLTTRLMAKIFGDDEEGPREAIDEMRKEVAGLHLGVREMAAALDRLGIRPPVDEDEKQQQRRPGGRK